MAIYLFLLILFTPAAWLVNRVVVDRAPRWIAWSFWLAATMPLLIPIAWWIYSWSWRGTPFLDPMLVAVLIAMLPVAIASTVAAYAGSRGQTA